MNEAKTYRLNKAQMLAVMADLDVDRVEVGRALAMLPKNCGETVEVVSEHTSGWACEVSVSAGDVGHFLIQDTIDTALGRLADTLWVEIQRIR